ncbi:MAG: hypothetical protein H7A35_09900 [Planctomycetales bacterium]|nr:hypothetical protein [bacterium]UNM07188.1 MAG: hypothetical protein H7A35_09900 [Planctomycetales bacterium]
MSVRLDDYGLDLDELANGLLALEELPNTSLLINEYIYDVREWRELEHSVLVEGLRGNALAVLAAIELTAAAHHLKKHEEEDRDWMPRFRYPYLLRRMTLSRCSMERELLQDFFDNSIMFCDSDWDLLRFIHRAIRWAERFAHLQPGSSREFTRINLQYEFARVIIEPPLDGLQSFIVDIMELLGIRVIEFDPRIPEEEHRNWVRQQLEIDPRKSRSRSGRLEFHEAGGTSNSIYVVRTMGGVDGFEVRGTMGEDLALIIDIGESEIPATLTMFIEEHIVTVINRRSEIRAELLENSLRLRWYDSSITAEDLGRIIHQCIKDEFVLSVVSVNMIFDPLRISSLRGSILGYKEQRRLDLRRRDPDKLPFIVCNACRSYAPHAFCVVSVDRPPCCGRSYDELASLAQLTHGMDQSTIARGICIDRRKGQYMGANKAARRHSEGHVSHINLHALREHPHPTTAIPQCIAYYIDEFDVICIVSSDYEGRTPDGKTFDTLLDRVAGRQLPGFLGISEDYILSQSFLINEGGLSRVAWMNSTLKRRLALRLENLATENECVNLQEFREFLATWSK